MSNIVFMSEPRETSDHPSPVHTANGENPLSGAIFSIVSPVNNVSRSCHRRSLYACVATVSLPSAYIDKASIVAAIDAITFFLYSYIFLFLIFFSYACFLKRYPSLPVFLQLWDAYPPKRESKFSRIKVRLD